MHLFSNEDTNMNCVAFLWYQNMWVAKYNYKLSPV